MEIGADVILKATKVDGIYSADPLLHKGAHKYDELTYLDVLKNQLKVMDCNGNLSLHGPPDSYHRLQFEKKGKCQAGCFRRKSRNESERMNHG